MPLLPNTLRDELVAIGNVADEESARDGWADAYATYFSGATSNGVPVGSVTAARNAMDAALVGLSTTGAVAIQAGITAFWGALVASPAVVFAGATVITPPAGLSNISADILLAAPLNVTQSNDATTALGFIASGGLGGNVGLHTLSLGGTATFPGPIVAPIL
jgi:hypothetical protein